MEEFTAGNGCRLFQTTLHGAAFRDAGKLSVLHIKIETDIKEVPTVRSFDL